MIRPPSGGTKEPRTGFAAPVVYKSALHRCHTRVYALSPIPPFGMETDVKTWYLIVVGAGLLTVVGATIAQQNTRYGAVPQPPAPRSERAAPPSPPQDPLVTTAPPRQTTGAKPEDLTIDELIEALDEFREQKAELEKKEKAYLKVLRRKAEKQKERIDGLGGGASGLPPTLIPGPVTPNTLNGPSPAPGISTLPSISN